MAKRIGVLLSGCGVHDGAEIHEATLTILALDKLGAEIVYIAPSVEFEVVDHAKGQAIPEKRNAMVEAARISRGNIVDAARARAKDLDALIMPGGMGAAKNLSSFAVKGCDCAIEPSVGKIIAGLADLGRPIGAICIAPATLAAGLRDIGISGVRMTVGNDPSTAAKIEEMGQVHVNCAVDDCVIDEEHHIVTTPAYMLAESIKEIQPGIDKLVRTIYDLAEERA
jgi:enhancing lycopene biosynthesis protein 2